MNNSLQIKRIMNEITEMKRNPSDMLVATPMENDLRTWHFTIRGPKDSDFEEGIYHGKIELSSEYPIKPPNLYFFTANGRFEVNTKICLNITKFHKESWNPAFTIRSMLDALINYFPIKEEGFSGIGALDYPSEERKKLAILSQKARCEKCGFLSQLLPVLKKTEDLPEEKKEEAKVEEDQPTNEKKELAGGKVENNEEKEEVIIQEKKEEKLLNKLKNLKDSIKEQQHKLNLPFLRGSLSDMQKKEKEKSELESDKKEAVLTFDSVLAELNLLQEVVKSIKFTKHPLNANEAKVSNEPLKKPKETEIPLKPEIHLPETKNTDKEEKKNLMGTFDENIQERPLIEDRIEVIQAKKTLKIFDAIVRAIQLMVVLAVIAFIYS